MEIAKAIRVERAAGSTAQELGHKYHLTEKHIQQIVSYRCWKE